MSQTLRQQLVTLFRESGHAHHQAFISADGADPEWPLWYANYLHDHINAIMKAAFTRSKLVQMILNAADDQEINAPQADWTEYYADYFLKHYPMPA
ncbi:MAG TPA: hypothetical protein VMT46_02385 [Anaerolineaceae bacterium]|nr:hypothetical protein [Anaerolineaceae bacterium]